MRDFRNVVVWLALGCGLVAAGKDRKKILLPVDILEAQTVLVIVEPGTGVGLDAPYANRTALEDVEKALLNWGRFRLVSDVSSADLVISVRKGTGRLAQETVGGVPINHRPVTVEPTDGGIAGAERRGNAPMAGDPTNDRRLDPHPQLEVGEKEDMFVVYRGKRDNVVDFPAVWRYTAKDGLRSPGVPAVGEFRKLVIEAEKQRAAAP